MQNSYIRRAITSREGVAGEVLMKAELSQLLELISAVEDFEPPTDSQAYLKRALLEHLDNAREILKCLVEDETK